MRKWRKTHPLTDSQRAKMNCRRYARTYQERGKLVPEKCSTCGKPSQMHHPDYSKPLEVRWFCRPCHLALHRKERIDAKLKGLDAMDVALTSAIASMASTDA
jgi:hypothetical protein